MAKRSNDGRLKLGQPWADKIADFCSANYNCAQIKVGETRASIANKLARGTFPAPFLLAAMAAMEEATIKIEDV